MPNSTHTNSPNRSCLRLPEFPVISRFPVYCLIISEYILEVAVQEYDFRIASSSDGMKRFWADKGGIVVATPPAPSTSNVRLIWGEWAKKRPTERNDVPRDKGRDRPATPTLVNSILYCVGIIKAASGSGTSVCERALWLAAAVLSAGEIFALPRPRGGVENTRDICLLIVKVAILYLLSV